MGLITCSYHGFDLIGLGHNVAGLGWIGLCKMDP